MKIIQPEAHILPFSGDVLKHVERCGRIAYKSEDAITEDSHVRFIQNIIKRGHESVLEHGNYVFRLDSYDLAQFLKVYRAADFNCAEAKERGYSDRIRITESSGIVSGNIRAWRDLIRVLRMQNIEIVPWIHETFYDNVAFYDLDLVTEGLRAFRYTPLQRKDLTPEEQYIHWTETALFTCDRSISHELVRHRALSPTQESQRFCNYSKGKFGGEVTFIQPEYFPNADGKIGLMPEGTEIWYNTIMANEKMYLYLLQIGMKPQQARKVLPNSTKTEVVLTGTIGEWVHFFYLRDADDADSEMRRLAKPLRTEFNVHYTV